MQVADLYTVAVGIWKKVDKTILREIAGEKGTVLAVEGFDQLAAKLRTVKKKVCGKLWQNPDRAVENDRSYGPSSFSVSWILVLC